MQHKSKVTCSLNRYRLSVQTYLQLASAIMRPPVDWYIGSSNSQHFKCAPQQRSRLDRAEAKICKVQPASEQLPKFEMNQEKGKGERRGEREEEEEEEGRGGERENEDFFSSPPTGGRERKCQVSLGVFFCS